MEQIYNKLVRDKIPEIIKSNREEPITRVLTDNEYKIELEKKLNEEYQEVLNATLEEVIAIANVKSSKRGAFNDKIFLEKVIEKSNQ